MKVYASLNINPAAEPTLSQGSKGGAVTELQEALVNAGYNPNGVDGSFGPGTHAAVVAFQRAHGLTADGVVGPNTWRALAAANNGASAPAPAPVASSSGEPLLREGASGAAVTKLQQELTADGFSTGGVDGSFGAKTLSAVEAFQRAHGLSADGVVGAQTWGALDGAHGSAPAPTPTNTSSGGEPTLHSGSSGAAVSTMQQLLTNAGYSTGGVDGSFGQKTLAALLSFQHAHGLSADGVCGPNTWAALKGAHSSTGTTPSPAPSGGSHATIQQGAKGSEVTELQQLLNKYGFSCSVDGNFGPGTAAEVRAYQSSRGLGADGVVGPATWSALLSGAGAVQGPSNPGASGDLRQRILAVAEGEIGTLEYGDTNNGPCAKYPGYFGRGPESWCADFASWVLTHAGYPYNDAWCPGIVSNAKSNGTWTHSPQPGDLVLFDWNGDGVADHVGIVKSVNGDGSIQTIEGNSDKPGTSQSGVWEHTRYPSTIMGYVNV
ncbi:MAG: peptidoglycan-binding protein [Deltaproteobacteria bacterium]|nr:peptidoglycan-binding protein [Deltaproteobacteria bacterium]